MNSIVGSSGKHMICDIKGIKNHTFLNNLNLLKKFLDKLCEKYDYTILTKSEHMFHPQGITILYMLSESHISIHTFPEHNYAAMDIYTCRYYENNDVYNKMYREIIAAFDAIYEEPIILDRFMYIGGDLGTEGAQSPQDPEPPVHRIR